MTKPSIALTEKPTPTQKVWGETRCVFRGSSFEVHSLTVLPGGYCSRHRHRKWNLFHVLEGQVEVELFSNSAGELITVDGRLLGPGDEFKVAPETFHRFVSKTGCKLLEVYWTVEIDPNDIERLDVGGLLNVEKDFVPEVLP